MITYALGKRDGAALFAEGHGLGGGLGWLLDGSGSLLEDVLGLEHGVLAVAPDTSGQTVVLDLGHGESLKATWLSLQDGNGQMNGCPR